MGRGKKEREFSTKCLDAFYLKVFQKTRSLIIVETGLFPLATFVCACWPAIQEGLVRTYWSSIISFSFFLFFWGGRGLHKHI